MRIANVKTLCMIRMVQIAKLHMKVGNLEDEVTIIAICIEETVLLMQITMSRIQVFVILDR